MKHIQTHILLLCALLAVLPLSLQAGNDKSLGLHTVCIDPGHGGQDPGTISSDKKTYEKTIVLSIAKKLAAKITAAYPTVKVIMTRSDDRFIALSERAEIANRNSADIFISIHINANSKSSPHGYSIHTLGQSKRKGTDLYQSNLELTKRENSVILLEDDYSTKYQGFDPTDPESFIFFNLMQNANLEQSLALAEDLAQKLSSGPITHNRGVYQDPFLVLWKTTMPSVLVEYGFMSNPSDLAVLRQSASAEKIAECLFKGFSEFKTNYDRSLNISEPPVTVSAKADAAASSSSSGHADVAAKADASKIMYGTQVLASKKRMQKGDPYFKGNAFMAVSSGSLYKYICGYSSSLEEAKKANARLKKVFKDSFLVKIEDGNCSRY